MMQRQLQTKRICINRFGRVFESFEAMKMSFVCDCDQVYMFSLFVYIFCFNMSTVSRVHVGTVRFMYLSCTDLKFERRNKYM